MMCVVKPSCSQNNRTLSTPQNNEVLYPVRQKALRQMFILSSVMLVLGLTSVAAGSLALVFYNGTMMFPINTGAPIWSGVLVIVASVFGLIGSKTKLDRDTEVPGKLKCMIGLFYGFSISLMSVCGLSLGYNAANAAVCATNDDACTSKEAVTMAMFILSSIVGMCAIVAAIFAAVFFCCYAKTFNMKRKYVAYGNQQNYEERINQLQRQVEVLQQNQATTTQQVETGSGYLTYGTEAPPSYNNHGFQQPPPSYTEKQNI